LRQAHSAKKRENNARKNIADLEKLLILKITRYTILADWLGFCFGA
jgi:hypothetical protein